MKKILALIMCAVMTVMCAVPSFADGEAQKSEISLNAFGEKLFALSILNGTDSDDCQVIDFILDQGEGANEIYTQIGSDAIVIGNNDQYLEIKASDVSDVLQEIMGTQSIGTGQIEAIAGYINSEDFAKDMQVIVEILSTEAAKLMLAANQSGLVTVADDGTVTIEGNLNTFVEIISVLLQDLGANNEAFTTLATTKIWSMLGLSADGKAEQEAVAAIAEQIKSVDFSQLGVDVAFKAVIKADGNIEFSYKVTSPEMTEEISIVKDGEAVNEVIKITNGEMSAELNLTINTETLTAAFDMSDSSMAMTGECELDLATLNLNGKLTVEDQTLIITGGIDAASENDLAYKITGTIEDSTVFEIAIGLRMIKSTETEQNIEAYVQVNGSEYALNADVTKEASKQGATFTVVIREGEQSMTLGELVISNEIIDASLEHKTGEAVSKEELKQLFEMILSSLIPMAE